MSYSVSLGYKHTQTSSSSSWVIVHNLNTNAPAVDCWIDISGTVHKVIPLAVTVDNVNQVTVTWSSAQSGVAYVA